MADYYRKQQQRVTMHLILSHFDFENIIGTYKIVNTTESC